MRNKLQENNLKKNQKNTLRCSFLKKKKKKSIFTKRRQEKIRLHSFQKKLYIY